MKNITLSLNDEIYYRSRVRAAELGVSLSALVRSFLVDLVQGNLHEDTYTKLKRLQDKTLIAIKKREAGLAGIDNLDREALYDRNALR